MIWNLERTVEKFWERLFYGPFVTIHGGIFLSGYPVMSA